MYISNGLVESEKMKKLKVFFLVALVSLFFIVKLEPTQVHAVAPNISIHVSQIKTFPNGTLISSNVWQAIVNITYLLDESINCSGTTDNNGWTNMFLNLTVDGMCNLKIYYIINGTEALYEPHTFDFHSGWYNTIYANVYDLAIYEEAKQVTIIDMIEVHLPSCIRFDFPQSTNINYTVNSHGLRVADNKSDTYYELIPLDISEPIYYPNGTFWYQANYTVDLTFTTLKEGFIAVTVIDNATATFYSSALYYVTSFASIKIHYVVHVVPYYMSAEMSYIETMLDLIYKSVKQIENQQNNSVIPMLNFMQTPFLTYLNEGNYTELLDKTKNIFGITTLSKDILLTVRSSQNNQSIPNIGDLFGSYQQTFYIVNLGMLLLIILSIYVTRQKNEASRLKEEGKSIVLKRNK